MCGVLECGHTVPDLEERVLETLRGPFRSIAKLLRDVKKRSKNKGEETKKEHLFKALTSSENTCSFMCY